MSHKIVIKEAMMRASYLFIGVVISGFLLGCQQESAESPSSVQTDDRVSSQTELPGTAAVTQENITEPIEAETIEEVIEQQVAKAEVVVNDAVSQQAEVVAPVTEKPVESLKAAVEEKPVQAKTKVEEAKAAVVEAEAPAVEVAMGDPIKGAKVSRKCSACHTFNQGGNNRVGPNLFGIVGSIMGSAGGFKYGPYLKAQNAAGVVWDEEKLRAWVLSSKSVAKAAGSQTKMPTQRIKDAKADDLIAYLKSLK